MQNKEDKRWLDPILTGQICPYCNCKTELVPGSDIYTGTNQYNDYRFFRCVLNRDHYIGTYASGRSLGRLADRQLRRKKMEAHQIFDSLWKARPPFFRTRFLAYQWLSVRMNLPQDLTHIGMFDVEQCDCVIRICKAYLAANRDNKKVSKSK